MKYFTFSALNSLWCVGLFAFLLSVPTLTLAADPVAKIKIGVSSPLTGEGATYGQDLKDFISFANERLGDGRYKLVFEDDRCNGRDAVSVAHKLINIDKVDFVTGFACSGATLAAAPIYEKAKMPTLITFASSPRIADAGDYIFRTFPSDALAGELLAKYMSKNFSSAAILSEETDYAQDLKNVFIRIAKQAGTNVIEEDYLPNTDDFKTILLRLKTKNPKAVFLNTQAEKTYAVILRQMKQLKWNPQVFGAYWPGSPSLQKVAGSDLEGVIFVDAPSLAQILNPEGKQLYDAYVAGGGKVRSTESVFATCYEAFRVLDQVVKKKQDFRKYLYETQFDGIFGPYSFDSKGEIKGLSLMLKHILHGKAVPLS